MIKLIKRLIKLVIILAIVGLAAYYFIGIDGILDKLGFNKDKEVETVELKNNSFKYLDIDLLSTSIYIKKGDSFKVESNNSKLSYEEKNDSLNIKETVNADRVVKKLIIYIPESTTFEGVIIENKAGVININTLNSKKMELSLGAGKCDIDNINITEEAKITGGAGAFNINNGSINSLNLDVGLGETSIKTVLTGISNIENNIGELNMSLIGSKDDYQINIEDATGVIKIDDEKVNEKTTVGNGINIININNTVGKTNIKYTK